jgi:hypothetical protein
MTPVGAAGGELSACMHANLPKLRSAASRRSAVGIGASGKAGLREATGNATMLEGRVAWRQRAWSSRACSAQPTSVMASVVVVAVTAFRPAVTAAGP